MKTCKFDLAWRGPCGEEAEDGDFCRSHTGVKCVSCGGVATRECAHTGIQFVCGYPLCDNCEHGEVPPDSLFGIGGKHQPKAALI